jgi:hypothetical protein
MFDVGAIGLPEVDESAEDDRVPTSSAASATGSGNRVSMLSLSMPPPALVLFVRSGDATPRSNGARTASTGAPTRRRKPIGSRA